MGGFGGVFIMHTLSILPGMFYWWGWWYIHNAYIIYFTWSVLWVGLVVYS